MRALLLAMLLFQVGNAVRFPTGTITGEIRESDGGVAAGVRVAVTPESNPDNVMVRIGQTDASGRYLLDNVAPGRYFVVAGVRAVQTYYPGVKNASEARAIVVIVGSTTPAVNFQLAKPTFVRVSAHLSGMPPGAPDGLFMGMLIPVSETGTAARKGINVDIPSDGNFTFPQVTAGLYELGVFPANGTRRIRFDVQDQDVGPIEITADGGNMWVRATIDEGGPIPGMQEMAQFVQGDPRSFLVVRVVLETRGFGPMSGRGGAYIGLASVRPNGLSRLMLPAGVYRIDRLELPMGFTLKSLTYGSVDLLTSSFQVSDPPAPKEIRMNLTTASPAAGSTWQKVSGRIEGLPQNRPAPAWVEIGGTADVTHGPRRIEEARLGEVQARADGTFEITGVPSGTYSVRASVDGSFGPPVQVSIIGSDVSGITLALATR